MENSGFNVLLKQVSEARRLIDIKSTLFTVLETVESKLKVPEVSSVSGGDPVLTADSKPCTCWKGGTNASRPPS